MKSKFCRGCGKAVSMSDFNDMLSMREYTISGFCQKCQDEIFRDEELSQISKAIRSD